VREFIPTSFFLASGEKEKRERGYLKENRNPSAGGWKKRGGSILLNLGNLSTPSITREKVRGEKKGGGKKVHLST